MTKMVELVYLRPLYASNTSFDWANAQDYKYGNI